jgi:hypothetical protein
MFWGIISNIQNLQNIHNKGFLINQYHHNHNLWMYKKQWWYNNNFILNNSILNNSNKFKHTQVKPLPLFTSQNYLLFNKSKLRNTTLFTELLHLDTPRSIESHY